MKKQPVRADANSIYDTLHSDILSGTLEPDTPVREIALAERFGVSRTPVREALRRLEHDRLLVAGPRSLLVRRLDTEEVIQIYDMRILLEGEASAQAAAARTTADLLRLEGLLERDRALQSPEDSTRATTNNEFHEAVWRATHNGVLQDLMQRLTVHLVRAPHSTLSTPGRWEQALDEHDALVSAIRAQNADQARHAATDHMRRAREIRLDLLRQATPTQ